MSEEEKKAIEYWKRDIALYHWNTQLASEHYAQIILNLIEKQQKEINNLKEIEQAHKTDNGLLRQELDMQIEHNKELDNILYAKQSMIDELTKNEENLKIELGEEKEKNKTKVDITDIEFSNFIKERYVSKDKIKELLENETIDISGFRCIAVEDIENAVRRV